MDNPAQKQYKLDRLYKVIVTLMLVLTAIAVIATFIQIYDINVKINNEVKQIQSAQLRNKTTINNQNGVILSYLQCIAIIQPQDRTKARVQACVDSANKSNVTNK